MVKNSQASEADTRRRLQELQLHQIELEMQNEELHRIQDGLQASWRQIDGLAMGRATELAQTIDRLSAERRSRRQTETALQAARAENRRLRDRLRVGTAYCRELDRRGNQGEFDGPSAALAEVRARVEAAARQDTPVLLLGEAGVGKGVAARAIHQRSARGRQFLVRVDCADQPAGSLERHLFGHGRQGAGARDGLGRFALADQGSLFLERIDALPRGLQAELERRLREQADLPGAGQTDWADVRIIASSSRDLAEEARLDRFHPDLWRRLAVAPIVIAPLRQRREDIPALVECFLARFNRQFDKRIEGVSAAAMGALQSHPWPGNVQELEWVVAEAVLACRGSALEGVDCCLGVRRPE